MDDIEALTERLRVFRDQRDWDQFHSPKNLAMALAAEVGELLAELRWLTEEQSQELASSASDSRDRVKDEIADVALFLLMLADRLNIDLIDAASDKLVRNAARFPVLPAVPSPSQPPNSKHVVNEKSVSQPC